jgi:hypothetical protein
VTRALLDPWRIDMNKKLILALLACSSMTAVAADTTAKSTKLMGYISDSKCAATHNAKAPDASCVKKCIGGGEKPVFVDAKKDVWSIDNPDTVTDDYGKAVTVMAKADSSAKSIHIDKVVTAKDVKGSSGMMDH